MGTPSIAIRPELGCLHESYQIESPCRAYDFLLKGNQREAFQGQARVLTRSVEKMKPLEGSRMRSDSLVFQMSPRGADSMQLERHMRVTDVKIHQALQSHVHGQLRGSCSTMSG